jgi:DeoR/GlpR family transcriptional regulator of sugar metabolism
MNRRQADILELLATRGELEVAAMARRFRVNQATVRRDFQYLEDEGHLVRSHGAAIPSPAALAQLAFVRKGQKNERQKRAIGRAVAGEIKPGMVVALDTGTTALEVARAITNIAGIKVLTTSLPIAAVLHAQQNIEVILMGGTVRRNDPDLSGALTEENLRRFRSDVAVLGADAAGKDGLFTTDMAIARTSQAMMSGAHRRVVAIDATKFAARGLFRYAPWDDVAAVYTDASVTASDRVWLKKLALEVHFVEKET